MSGKRIHLTIDAPCQQNWQGMKPEDAGRFCSSCQKTVVDFTGLTNEQIADIIEKQNQLTCGRFRVSQLNRSLVIEGPTSRSPARFFSSLMAAGLFGYQTVQAESVPTQADPVYVDASRTALSVLPSVDETIPTDSSRVITGRVVDQSDSAAVQGASVLIKETSLGVSTDTEGHFQLTIPAKKTDGPITLRVTMIGYQAYEMQLVPDQRNSLSIGLQQDVAALGEVVMAGNYKKLSFWQRLRNRFRAIH